jgi:hypothetical protein
MSGPVVTQADRDLWDEILYIWRMEFDPDGHRAIARHREASVAAKDAEIAKLQEIVRTQAEEAAKATYYYTDKMDELKKECEALAGALEPFAKSGELLVNAGDSGEFWAYRPAAGNEYSITGGHLIAAHTTLAQHKGDA